MSAEDNKAVVLRFYEELCNDGDLSIASEIFTKDVRYVGLDSIPPSEATGPHGIVGVVKIYQTAFSDAHWDVQDIDAGEGTVTVRWVGTGTQDGLLGAIPPTGKYVRVKALSFFKLKDGKISEVYDVWDALALLQQLGLAPAA